MYKKSILSLAIASTLTLTGCLDNNKIENRNTNATQNPVEASDVGTYPIFNPGTSSLPIPNDLIFDSTAADGTFAVTPDPTNPAVTALQSLSGASPIAPIDIEISARIDPTTLANNVHLVELEYASGDPVRGLSASEPPTIPANPLDWPTIDVSEIELDGTSYIRINPTTRLDPLTRYVVVITDGVKDINGDSLVRSPSVSGYDVLTNEDQGLASPALAAVRNLINGLWEPIALNYLDAIGQDVTADNLVLTYSFTTSDDEKVLEYIADPAQWFNDQLTRFIGSSTAASVVTNETDVDTDGDVDYTDVNLAVTAQIAAFPDAATQTALDGAGLTLAVIQSVPGCGAVTNGAAYISCLSAILGSPAGPFGALLPTPAAATVSFDDANSTDINLVTALASNLGIPAGVVSVTEGTIEVPHYLSEPAGANGQPLVTDSWVADDTLATAINGAFAALGLTIPQADPLVSDVVNYVFPFPKKQSDLEIPILAIHPTTPAGDMTPVMYQHGITTDRSAALAFGSSMVAGAKGLGADLAIIAIDQPLHGIDGISPAEQAALAEQLMTAGGVLSTPDGVIDGIDADEQASIDAVVAGLFSAGVVQGVDAATNSGAPGATNCVDLGTNGLVATTNSILGGACDADPVVTAALGGTVASSTLISAQVLERTVAFGASTIPGLAAGSDDERHFGFTSGGAGVATAMDFAGSSAANSSGSMFINLTSFLTTRDNLRQLSTDLLTVRMTLDTMDLNGGGADLDDTNTFFIGHSLGTVNGLPFVVAANGSSTTADDITAANLLTPGGGVTRLIENSPAFSGPILAGLAGLGLTQDTASFQAFLNILQAASDAGDAINFADRLSADDLNTPILFTEVLDDATIPNSVDEADEVLGDGSISFLSGTEPLFAESGATKIIADSALTQNYVQYTEGFHGTPVFPSSGSAEEADAFAEMIGQATSMVLTGGTSIDIDDTDVLDTNP